jgi:spermidine/putrescine-binding protein
MPTGFPPAPGTTGEPRLRRRDVLVRAAQLGIGIPAGVWIGAACGGSSGGGATSAGSGPAPITGTPVLLNYSGWMGKNIVSDFEAKYPGAGLKQIPEASISNGAVVPALKANLSTYDAALGDQAVVGQAIAAGVLQPLDFSKIPNIKNVDPHFRNAYSHGVVSDYGKTGIAYRSDLVSETITSWADFWRLAPKYSGKVVCMDFDRDVIGSALKYTGHSTNTTSTSDLNDALQAMLQLKPHLQAIKAYNVGAGLAKGTSVMAMDWDYDTALVQQEDPRVKWVLPEEGATAYLEGFFAVKDTPDLATLEAFFNFFLEPKQYADFVNTVNSAYVMAAAKPYIKKSISESPTLSFDATTLAKVEFESYVGEAIAQYTKIWDEFKSA